MTPHIWDQICSEKKFSEQIAVDLFKGREEELLWYCIKTQASFSWDFTKANSLELQCDKLLIKGSMSLKETNPVGKLFWALFSNLPLKHTRAQIVSICSWTDTLPYLTEFFSLTSVQTWLFIYNYLPLSVFNLLN